MTTSPQGGLTLLRRIDLDIGLEPEKKRMRGNEGTPIEMEVDDCSLIPEARTRLRDHILPGNGTRNLCMEIEDDITLEESTDTEMHHSKMDIDENYVRF